MNLMDLISGSPGNQVTEEASNRFGLQKGQVGALLAVAAPLIISALRRNAQDPTEAENINSALQKHDGSVLENPTHADLADGSSIIDHIFGNKKTQVETRVAQKTGIGMDKIGPLLSMIAPVVMGYVGQQRQQNNVNSGGGISDLLGGILNQAQPQASSGNMLQDLATNFLDKDNDGSMLDDLMGMFGKRS